MADNKDKKILNVPALRFSEFSGEWKEERLDEIAELSKGVGISKEQLSEDGEPCILYGELYTKYKSEIIHKVISKANIESSNLKRSKRNDVIIPCSGETAIDIAVARCVPFDNILLGGDLNIIRLHKDDGAFMAYQLNGKRKIDIAKLAQGVSVVHLYGENIKAIKTYNPCLLEQQKIVKLLSMLDERMELQNKIIEDLKLLRDAISVHLLSPKSDWKCYKVSEIADIGRGRVISSKEIANQKNPRYPVYSSQTSNEGIMGYLDDYAFDGEYITWTTDGANAGTVFYRNGRFNCTNVCGTLKLHYQFDAYYCSLVLANATKKYVSINLANPKLMNSTMAAIKLYVPPFQEQKRMAQLFRKIDENITLEHRLLLFYQNQKHYLLKQMFI